MNNPTTCSNHAYNQLPRAFFFFLHSAHTFRFGLFLFIKFKPSTHSSKAGSAEMSKTPLETCVYIIVKCVTCCCAVSTQVSRTISRGSCSRRKAKQWQHKANKSRLPTPRVTPKALPCCSAAATAAAALHWNITQKPDTVQVRARASVQLNICDTGKALRMREICCAIFKDSVTFLLSSGHPRRPAGTLVWQNRWPPPLPPLSQAIQRSADASALRFAVQIQVPRASRAHNTRNQTHHVCLASNLGQKTRLSCDGLGGGLQ